jgi:lipocalin
MVEGEKGINGAGIYDEKAKNSRVKVKFINPFMFLKNYFVIAISKEE